MALDVKASTQRHTDLRLTGLSYYCSNYSACLSSRPLEIVLACTYQLSLWYFWSPQLHSYRLVLVDKLEKVLVC